MTARLAAIRREVTIEASADILLGYPFKSANYVQGGSGVRLLRGDNVGQGVLRWDGAKCWPSDAIDAFQQFSLVQDDIILAMDRPWIEAGLKWARVRSADLPALLVQRVACLRAKAGVDQRYLAYVIASQAFTDYVLGVQTGTAVPHISGRQIGDFKFLLPPLPEQRAIAAVLGALDDKIEANRRINATLEATARALFKSWFVDFDPVRAKAEGRDTGLPPEIAALFPDSFEESELGEVPTGWAIGKLDDIVAVNPTRSLRKGDVAPYLDMANMPEEGHVPDDVIDRPFGSGMKFANGDTL